MIAGTLQRQYARIVVSRTLRPDWNDVPLGSISPKNMVESLDLLLGGDDRVPACWILGRRLRDDPGSVCLTNVK